MNNRLDSFDILARASGELSVLAENCGIDWQKLHGLINSTQTTYKRGIELEKKYRGSVVAYVHFKTAKSGQDYPVITFSTRKHGSVNETFNGWQWLENNGYTGGKKETHAPQSAATPKAEQPKFKPVEKIPARACVACKTDFIPPFENSTHCEYCYTLAKFNNAQKLYDTLPPVQDVAGYLSRKAVTIEDLQASGLVIKRGQDKRGAFVIVQATNGEKITGYQRIYDSKFVGYDGELRDKDFIFFPRKNPTPGQGNTYKTGSYIVLGSLDHADKGLYFVEGLATGLSVFKATGKTVIVCFDAGNLSPAMANFSDYTRKYIAADNDYHADNTGNTGIYSALKAAKRHKARVFVPVATDTGLKVDFNDLEQLEGLKKVKLQLRTRDNSNEVSPSRENLFKYCPVKQLKNLALSHCYQAAGSISTKAQFKSHSKALQNLFNGRGFTEFKARKYIFSVLKKRVQFMQESNCFSGHELVTRINVKGLSNEAIAAKVANLKGLVIDNRGMAAGKTELMRLIAEQLRPIDDSEKIGFTAEQWENLDHNKLLNQLIQKIERLNGKIAPVEPHSIVAIAHRTSLIDSLSNRLGLPHYDRVRSFNPEHVAVCLPSITKFESMKATVLFIDEFRQNLDFMHNSGGCIDNPLAVEKQLIEWINGAGLTIAADADFNQASLEWILTNCPSIPIYWLDNGKQQSNGKTIQLLESNQFVINNLIGQAVNVASNGGRVWLAFDGITQAEKAYDNFIAAGVSADKILLVHGENKADIREALFLDNPNEESEKYQVIIHTPVISSGVSITKQFDFVGAGFCGVLAPNAMIQTVARVRTAKNIYVALLPNNDHTRPDNVQSLIDGESTKRGRYCEEAGSLTLTSFDRFRLNQIATTNQALNYYEQNFKFLAQLKGYTLNDTATVKATLAVSTKDVKAIVCSEILADNANLTESEFKELDKKTATTQAESNALFKYQAKGMAGKAYTELNGEDVYFFKYDNGLSKVKNAELINADISELKDHDRQNHETRQKLASDTSKAFLFSYVINALSGQPVKRALIQHCLDFLRANDKEAAANGLRNTRDLFKFVERAGYELVAAGRDPTGGREEFYTLQLNPLVAEYLANRARLKSEAKEQKESELMPEFEF